MTDLRELEKRLEEATAGSDELDKLIADHFGIDWLDESEFLGYGLVKREAQFSRSLDALAALVERVLPGWYWASHSSQYWDNGRPADKCFLGGVYDASPPEINGKNFVVHKQTAALALCLALIRALIAKGDRHD